MAANEIAERLAAAAWFSIQPDGGGDPDPATFTMRSLTGFSQVLYRDDVANYVVAVLDRELSRRETAILVQAQFTQATDTRVSYPSRSTLGPDSQALAPRCEPFHLDWLPDIDNPPYTWFPFRLGSQFDVPEPFDLDRYNALCFELANVVVDPATGDSVAIPRDWSVLIVKHPPIDAQSITVLDILPGAPS